MNSLLNENSPEIIDTSYYRPARQTPKKSQQEIMFAFHSSQRKKFISGSRQKIQMLNQIKQGKIDKFIDLFEELSANPNDLRFQQMMAYFNNEKEDLNEFATSWITQYVIQKILHTASPFVNKILLFLIELDLDEKDLKLIKALSYIFFNSKDQECHTNCLRLLLRMFRKNLELVALMKYSIFVNIFYINIGDSLEILKLVSQICLIFYENRITYYLDPFKQKIFFIFSKALHSKDIKIINGILFLLKSLDEEDRRDIIGSNAFKIHKLCLDKFDESNQDLCETLFKTLLQFSYHSIHFRYRFLTLYIQILLSTKDYRVGQKGILLLLDELWVIQQKGIYQDTAASHLNIIMNILDLACNKGIAVRQTKIKVQEMLDSFTVRRRLVDRLQIAHQLENQDEYYNENQDEKQNEDDDQ